MGADHEGASLAKSGAESGFAIQRRMLDAYVVGCTEREQVYHQHAQFVRDYPGLKGNTGRIKVKMPSPASSSSISPSKASSTRAGHGGGPLDLTAPAAGLTAPPADAHRPAIWSDSAP